ncbi:protein ANTAGONIST OF LIKE HETEROCHROMATIN PROTEIN 1-like [Rhizophagus clarus]|uniref:Protein ANTAGONIST OF LIKE HETEROCHROMATIN PROTEIN 1-like n=1 Tax=Rhizophagus clarus TaxID=94130 RepID=A0A8H3L134_9GLOM|nr:protein ANTAGONIST OF LIKE HETEROCHROMATIN PROTEIN 1-like [Rhizophagus clarus]
MIGASSILVIKRPQSNENKQIARRRLGSKDDILSICSQFRICEGFQAIRLNEAPAQNPTAFFTRKKDMIHYQEIVNFKGIFINYIIGWSGSVHNAQVYANSDFFLNKAKYIDGDDYVLVVVENVFSRLKARFKALRELSVKDITDQNDNDDDNNNQYDWKDKSDEILKLEGELKRERMLNQFIA